MSAISRRLKQENLRVAVATMLPRLRPIGGDSRGRERTPEPAQVGDWSKLVGQKSHTVTMLENRCNRVRFFPPTGRLASADS
jgi:hypothetical protein